MALKIDIIKKFSNVASVSGIQPNFYTYVNSPTYNLTLFIVHPEVSNEPSHFLGLDRLQQTLNRGAAHIISQSGVTADRYIDNVVMTSFARESSALGNVATTSINFDIIEPLKFNLMQDILKLTKKFKFGNMQNALYVMKLDFKGRDEVMDIEDTYPTTHFFPLTFTNIASSIGPEGARYNILANMKTKTALSQATITQDLSFTCTTPSDFVKNLQEKLNAYELKIRGVETLRAIKSWKIKLSKSFLDTYENTPLHGLASDEASLAKVYAAGAGGSFVAQRTIQVGASIPTFVRDTLVTGLAKQLVDNGHLVKMKLDIKHFDEIDQTTGQLRKEITIEILKEFKPTKVDSSIQKVLATDKVKKVKKEREDAAKQRQILDTIKNKLHKKYEYVHTGKNTEVLDVDIQYNLLYFDEKAPSDGRGSKDQSQVLNPDLSPMIGGIHLQKTSSPYLGDLGDSYLTPVSEISAVAVTDNKEGDGTGAVAQSIKDHEMDGYTTAMQNLELSIIGDPYWIGSPDAETIPDGSEYSNKQNEGRDVHIAFINKIGDISFASTGERGAPTMDLASSGIYRVANITSRLSGGKFTQQLSAFKDPDITTEYLQTELNKL